MTVSNPFIDFSRIFFFLSNGLLFWKFISNCDIPKDSLKTTCNFFSESSLY